jgi:hypothetical protein
MPKFIVEALLVAKYRLGVKIDAKTVKSRLGVKIHVQNIAWA